MGDLKYGEFEFPSDRGFTGSAGQSNVKGYMRGGHVKGKKTVGVTTEKGPRASRPKNTMTKAARGGHMHDNMMKAGKKMGYAKGGYTKARNVSSEFDMKSKPQDTMDHGTYPPQSNNQAEKEAGGRKRLKPKFKKGGKAHKKGGLAEYAEGGSVSAGHLGTGGARKAAVAMREREERVRSTVDEALKDQGKSRTASPRPKRKTHDKPPAKPKATRIYREDKEGVPTFTDTPKTGKRVKMAEGGHWIQKAIKKPGALRKSLGVKKGQDIPAKKLATAAKKPGKMGQRARLAETLKKMH